MAKKPTFVLHGRIITMQTEQKVINSGYIAIEDGMIAAIAETIEALPENFRNLSIIETAGTIYPGLIDLHNHFANNFFPLWVVPQKFDNRSQWRELDEYKRTVKNPGNRVSKYSVAAKAIMRYVEAKAIIGGTTTGQGIGTKVTGVKKIYEGAMRNVEIPGDVRLKACGNNINDMKIEPAEIDKFRRMLNDDAIGFFFHHLSEGVDASSQEHFTNLKVNDLINEKLVGIHSLGLHKGDLEYMASKKAKIVWSPFSNQILYGKTLNLKDLKDSGVLFCLGCDWTPSGSKNLLEELKVAKFSSIEQGNIFSDYELVQMVTSNAANVTGWQKYLGTIDVGKMADLLVIKGDSANPYAQLITSTENNIDLVVIDGIARYGTESMMRSLHFDLNNKFEKVTIENRAMGIYLYSEFSEINDIGYANSVKTLKDILKDIPAFLAKMNAHEFKTFQLLGEIQQDFQIIMDMDEEEHDFEIQNETFKRLEILNDPDPDPVPQSIEFDEPTATGTTYWQRVHQQPNLTKDLKDWLSKYYE